MRGEGPISILMVDDEPQVLRSLRAALESHGYRVRNVRGRGVAEASWSEVETVTGGPGTEGAVMQITLRGGRSSVVPLVLLGPQAVVAEREIHERLNAAFGYRRLGTA